MTEQFEYQGVWWLPETPEQQIPGTLKFTPNAGATLELIGSFKEIKNMEVVLQPEIVLGLSSDGKSITLQDCFETKSTTNIPSMVQISSLFANFVFTGVHFQKREYIKFNKLFIHYSNLDEWVNISGFNIVEDFSKKEVTINYKLPEPIHVNIGEDYGITVGIKATFPGRSIVQKEAKVAQTTYICIEPCEQKLLDDYLRVAHKIQNLLTLAVGEPVYPLAMEGKTEVNKQTIDDKLYYPTVGVFYTFPNVPKEPKTIAPYKMLFTFKEIADRFEYFANNWFKKAEVLEPVYDLYFATLYNPRMYLQQRFLSLVHAVEAYHRRTMKNYELPEDEHNNRIEEILNMVPAKHKKWLENKLTYSSELTLRKRLREILDSYWDIGQLKGNKDKFISKVLATRNYLIHYDSKLKDQTVRGEQLYRITLKLRTLMEILLLTVLGFGSEDIKILLCRRRRFQGELENR